MKLKHLTLSILVASLPFTIAANEEESSQIETSGFYGSIGQVSFDDATAYYEGIDNSATYWRFGWEQQLTNLVWGAGVSGYVYDDKESFSQRTRSSLSGDEQDSDSGAVAINGYIEGGYLYRVNENIKVSFMAGYEAVFSSDRSIGNCSDCYSEDIDVASGVYFQPRVTYQWENEWYVRLSTSSYLSGDVDSNVMLSIGVQQ